MNKYELEVTLASVYHVEIIAEDRDTAISIAEDINPADDERCTFLEVRRDITNEDEESVTDILSTYTDWDWDIVPTGGGCTAIQAELDYGIVSIATADAQAPTHAGDVVTVYYCTTEGDTVLMNCNAKDLFERSTCANIFKLATTEQNKKRNCPKCGQPETDCHDTSKATVQMVKAIEELMHHVSEENREHLAELLEGYTVHAVSECNEASRA